VQHSQEYSIGYERQVGGSASVSADYVRIAGRDLLMTLNLNPGLRDNDGLDEHAAPHQNPNFTAASAELVNTGQTTTTRCSWRWTSASPRLQHAPWS